MERDSNVLCRDETDIRRQQELCITSFTHLKKKSLERGIEKIDEKFIR